MSKAGEIKGIICFRCWEQVKTTMTEHYKNQHKDWYEDKIKQMNPKIKQI